MTNLAVNFKEVFKYLIPIQIRGSRAVAWLGSMLAPLQTLNGAFASWGASVRYDLGFTGQQANLEHVLNDQHDPSLRRIFITDPAGSFVFTTFIFNQIEQQPTAIIFNQAEAGASGTAVLRNFSEVFANGLDFVVKIPSSLNVGATLTKMKSLINKYKQAGKNYSFENI